MKEGIPIWGQVVSVLMICASSVGACFQGYKILIPITYLSDSVEEEQNYIGDDFASKFFDKVDKLFELSQYQLDLFTIIGAVGLVITIAYFAAGIRLLWPKYGNYVFAKNMLIIFLGFNIISCFMVVASGFSFYTLEFIFFSFVGIIVDVALLLVVLLSDHKKYKVVNN